MLKRRLSVILLLTFVLGEIYLHFQPGNQTATAPPVKLSWQRLASGAYQELAKGSGDYLLAANLDGAPFAELVRTGKGYRIIQLAYRSFKPSQAPVGLQLAQTTFHGRRYWRPLGSGWDQIAISSTGRVAGLIGHQAYLANGRNWEAWSGVSGLQWSGPNLLLERFGRLWQVAPSGQLRPWGGPLRWDTGHLALSSSDTALPSIDAGEGLPTLWQPPAGWQWAGYPVSKLGSGQFLVSLVREGRLATFLVRTGLFPAQQIG